MLRLNSNNAGSAILNKHRLFVSDTFSQTVTIQTVFELSIGLPVTTSKCVST